MHVRHHDHCWTSRGELKSTLSVLCSLALYICCSLSFSFSPFNDFTYQEIISTCRLCGTSTTRHQTSYSPSGGSEVGISVSESELLHQPANTFARGGGAGVTTDTYTHAHTLCESEYVFVCMFVCVRASLKSYTSQLAHLQEAAGQAQTHCVSECVCVCVCVFAFVCV
jgi:hypothetical protein